MTHCAVVFPLFSSEVALFVSLSVCLSISLCVLYNRADYVKGPHWYDAKRINSVVLSYGELLLGAISTAIFHVGAPPGATPPPVRLATSYI